MIHIAEKKEGMMEIAITARALMKLRDRKRRGMFGALGEVNL